MRRTVACLGWILLAWMLSCGASDSDSKGSDGGGDGGGGQCCPPDPAPGCCMKPGGWSDSGQCAQICDGIPLPSDPGWSLGKDEHGCSVWSNPKSCYPTSGAGCCGGVLPTDAATDAPADGG